MANYLIAYQFLLLAVAICIPSCSSQAQSRRHNRQLQSSYSGLFGTHRHSNTNDGLLPNFATANPSNGLSSGADNWLQQSLAVSRPSRRPNRRRPQGTGTGTALTGRPATKSNPCATGDVYYSFNPNCQRKIEELQDILFAEPNADAVIKKARELKNDQNYHPRAWFAALTTVSMMREDMRGLKKPFPEDVLPTVFIGKTPTATSSRRKKRQAVEECMPIDERFAVGNGVENRLWYFREDVQLNSHHWYWHRSHPFRGAARQDRSGEQFFYVHRSMLARYNAERLSNGLELTTPLNLRQGMVMKDPYFSNLVAANSGNNWANRAGNITILDNFDGTTIDNFLQSTQNVLEGVRNGYLLDQNNQEVWLDSTDGIDLVGAVVENPGSSFNPDLYGNVHGTGHILIAFTGATTEIPGVMADTAVSMRDFAFYNWHAWIDDLFETHKVNDLSIYMPNSGELQLVWTPVTVTNVQVTARGTTKVNEIGTFWSSKKIKLSRGIDLEPDTDRMTQPNVICMKHLNHEEFDYKITANLRGRRAARATIRVFLAPRYGSNGQRLSMAQQRRLFFVMDQFNYTLQPGQNIISRTSEDSSVTIPWRQSYDSSENLQQSTYCGCGWPHHLLLPKGNSTGMTFDLFTMITNGVEDAVVETSRRQPDHCEESFPLCGLLMRKYPDSKPMGYPFDRPPFRINERRGRRTVTRQLFDIDEYKRYIQNAFVTPIVIKHEDKVV